MKTRQEIMEKINEYMEKVENGTDSESDLAIIDALLWVIGDASGKPI